jgi:flagellar hook-associated protein 2
VDKKQAGPLFGDGGVSNLVDQLRRTIGTPVSGVDPAVNMLVKIGISADVDGHLMVDGTKLDAAFAQNFNDIGELVAAPNTGVAAQLDTLLDPYLQTGGVFDGRKSTIDSSIKDIGDQRDALNTRLAALQDLYTKQFNALDTLLAQMQSTSNFLTQQLANLPGSSFFTKGS